MNSLSDLAMIISYPTEDNFQTLVVKSKMLEKNNPDLSGDFFVFKEFIQENSKETLEEIYTKTFDIQGVCSLDLGYVLFGEEYRRGAFLVNVTRMLREFNVDPGSELADHLPNVLSLVSVMPESEERWDFIEKILIPSLEKMIEKFPLKEDGTNIYRFVLDTTKRYLESRVANKYAQ